MLNLNGRLRVDLVASEYRYDEEDIISKENSKYFRLEKEFGENLKCKNILDTIMEIRKEIENDDSIKSKNCGKQTAWVKASDKIINEAELTKEEYEYVHTASRYIFREHSLATLGLIGLLGL